MYTIIGADGREYGPVSLDQLHQWIAEGRANSQTKVRPEGATDWKPISEISELSTVLPVQPASVPSGPAPYSTARPPKTNQMAMAGLILGILSVTLACCCYGLPFNIAGIICSIIALSQLSKDSITQEGKGYAIAGLILSIFSMLIAGLLLIFSLTSSDLLQKINHL
jgi:hypothetical protein